MKFNIYIILTWIVFAAISCSDNSNEEIHSSQNLQEETSKIVSSSPFTIEGKITNAMEFNKKITPKETAMSFSGASITGATAAIALPPHIAVPEEIR